MTEDGNNDNNLYDFLSACSDEELVSRCTSFNNSAPFASELILRYFGFIKKKASQLCGSVSSYDDFVQEGLLGLINAVKGFDPNKGTDFSSFAAACIVNRIKNAAAKQNRTLEREDNSDNKEAEDRLTPESIIIEREFYSEICSVLSPLEYKIFRLFITGLTYSEIAQRTGITPKAADNAVQRARKKLRGKMFPGS